MQSEHFSWPVRVYYEDTDSSGLVYHASYVRFMERARTEWLRNMGYELGSVLHSHGCLFTVSKLEIQYLKPARLSDALTVGVRRTELGRASFTLEQDVSRGAVRGANELLCRGKVRIACVDSQSLRPRAMPTELYTELESDR